MNLKAWTEAQRRALLDLMVLGVYSDANFAVSEDAALHQLLAEMGFPTVDGQNHELDAAITRVRKNASSVAAAEKYARSLAEIFQAKDQRRQVQDQLSSLLNVDGKLTEAEKKFASAVDDALRL